MGFSKFFVFFLAFLAVLVGCGAPLEDDDDLGRLEQEFGSRPSLTYGYGVTTSSSALACKNVQASGTVCTVPASKAVRWLVEGTNADAVAIRNLVSTRMVNMGFLLGNFGWTFTESPLETANLIVNSSPCSGTLSSNITGYVCANRTFGQSLTELNVQGHYQTHTTSVVHIDSADIKNKGASSTQDANLLKHAVNHGIIAHMGIGGRTDLTGTKEGFIWSQNQISPQFSMNLPQLTQGEVCRLQSYQTGGTTWQSFPAGCPTDPQFGD